MKINEGAEELIFVILSGVILLSKIISKNRIASHSFAMTGRETTG